jgi:hypothetical protein
MSYVSAFTTSYALDVSKLFTGLCYASKALVLDTSGTLELQVAKTRNGVDGGFANDANGHH